MVKGSLFRTAVLVLSITLAGSASAQNTVTIGMVMPMTGPLAAAGQEHPCSFLTKGAKMEWSDRIGRRIRLRDLHIVLGVAEAGSMAKAAQRLAI